MSLYDNKVVTIDGQQADLSDFAGTATLIVNVASQCGLTPQYAGLQQLHERYQDRGFAVLGFPSNQFGAQEPGTEDEIKQFCETSYGVTFPMFAKIDVNGSDRHPLYAALTQVADGAGKAGDVEWNFEKFVVDPDGNVVARIRSTTDPLDPTVVGAIEQVLPR